MTVPSDIPIPIPNPVDAAKDALGGIGSWAVQNNIPQNIAGAVDKIGDLNPLNAWSDLAKYAAVVTSKHFWWRLGIGYVGMMLIMWGIVLLIVTSDAFKKQAKNVVNVAAVATPQGKAVKAAATAATAATAAKAIPSAEGSEI